MSSEERRKKLQLPSWPATLRFLGVLGIIFYVVNPIFFPDIDDLRQPELLPLYTFMIGLGEALMHRKKEN